MSKKDDLNWQSLIFSALLLLLAGSFQLAKSQEVPQGAVTNDPSNPIVKKKYLASSRGSTSTKGSKTLSPAAEKRAAIEQAIKDGNEAREANNYEKAFASYRHVAEKLNPKDPRAIYGIGNVYFDLGCNDQAMQAYSDALRLDKNFRDALITLGYAFAKKERYEDADVQFHTVLKKNPNDAGAKIALAFLSWKLKKQDEALNQLKAIADNQSISNTDRASAHLLLADFFLEQKKWNESARESKTAISLNPSLAIAYINLGQAELFPAMEQFSSLSEQEIRPEDNERVSKAARRATEHFRAAINEHGYKHPYGNLFMAYGLMWQRNYREAESHINNYLSRIKSLETQLSSIASSCESGFAPLQVRGYYTLTQIYQRASILEPDDKQRTEFINKAIQNLKNVIQLKEGDAGAYSTLGQIYLRQGRYHEAIETLDKAISHETNEKNKAWQYAGMGEAYLKIDHYAEALDYLNKAIKIQPEVSIYYVQAASIYEKQGNFDEAIRLKKEAMVREKELRAHTYYFLATTYFLKAQQTGSDSDYEEATRLSNKALEVNRSYGSGYFMLGQIYKFYKNGTKANEAVVNFELALKYEPKNPLIPFALGDLYFRVLKNDDAAIKYFHDAVALKPDFAEAYYELGLAYHRKQENEEAIKQFQNAINYNQKHLGAYIELADTYDRQKRYSDAIDWLLKATRQFPTHYLPYKELGRVYSHLARSEDAIQNYEEAIKRVKDEDSWLRHLYTCRIKRLQNNFAEAIKCYEEIKLPNSADPGQIIYEIGATYVASKNKKGALAQYEQLRQRNSTMAEDLLRQINEMK